MESIALANNKIDIIIHLSDIHIRKNSDRCEEYEKVLSNLYIALEKEAKNKSILIICTGDIFHDGLSSYSIMTAKKFFINLCEICDVIVIRGVYDRKQLIENTNTNIDMISSVLFKLQTKHNLYILEKTGEYVYGNIAFGYTEISDKHIYHMINENEIKIALYYNSHKQLPELLNFDDYDYVMLGGNHNFQYMNEKKTMAYSGSLIQQNFDETLENHGYVRWDLKKKESHIVNVKNEYGYVTLKVNNNKLDEKIIIPENVNLRVIYEKCDEQFIQETKKTLTDEYNVISYEEEIEREELKITLNVTEDKVIELENKNADNNIIREQLIDYIKPEQNEIEQIKKVIDMNLEKLNYNYDKTCRTIKIKKVLFDNFNVFGEGNFIDYENLKGIVNVCGKNGIGKSSVAIHLLMCAIYGRSEEYNNCLEYINNRNNNMKILVVADITIDSKTTEYIIVRRAKKVQNKENKKRYKLTEKVSLYENNNEQIFPNVSETERKIMEIFGEQDNFFVQSIIDQKKDTSFLSLAPEEKTKWICNILRLDVYEKLEKSIENEKRSETEIINMKTREFTPSKQSEMRENITMRNYEMKQINEEVKTLESELYNTRTKKIELELKLKELENIKGNKKVNIKEDDINEKKNELMEIKSKCEISHNKIDQKNNEIKKFKNMEQKNNKFQEEKQKNIKKIQNDIDELREKYTKQAPLEKNKTELINERKGLNEKIAEISIEMDQLIEETKQLKENENKPVNKKKYNKYLELTETRDNYLKQIRTNNCQNLIERLREFEIQIGAIKNHKVNKKCEVCMKNDIVMYKNILEEKIKETQKILEENNTEVIDIDKLCENIKELEKYNRLYKENEKNNQIVKENEKTLESKQNMLDNLKLKLEIIEKKIEEYDKKQRTIEMNKEIKKQINEKTKELEELKQKEFEDYDNYKELLGALEKLTKRWNELTQNMKELEGELKEMKNNFTKNKEIYAKLSECEESESKHKQVAKKLEKLTKELKQKNAELLELNNILTKDKIMLEQFDAINEEVEEKKKMNEIRIKIIKVMKEEFLDDLLRTNIIPRFEHQLNKILASFVNFKIHMEYDARKIFIYKEEFTDGGMKYSDARKLSGFETLMTNIGFKLVTFELNKLYKTNFFIIDEGFAYCDENSLVKMSKLFDYVRKIFDYVLIISHNEQIKSYTDMDLKIENEKGFSRVRMEINGKDKSIENLEKIMMK